MGKYKLINKFTLISSLFIILILTTGMSNQNNSFSGKIFKNIYIEQVHVGKMKLDEAKDAVDKKYLLKPIYMKYKDKTWCIIPQEYRPKLIILMMQLKMHIAILEAIVI